MKNILFKELSKLEQEIIYEYNSQVYILDIENAKIFKVAQKGIINGIIEKHKLELSEYSINKIKFYVSKHRKYYDIGEKFYGTKIQVV